jgi:hypothetical protein
MQKISHNLRLCESERCILCDSGSHFFKMPGREGGERHALRRSQLGKNATLLARFVLELRSH